MENNVETKKNGKWSPARLVIGILSIVLCAFILFQSCVAGLSNAISENGESGGSFGALIAILMLVAGIVAIVTRKSDKKGGPVTCCILYWICFLCSRIGAGSYGDLKVWGGLAFAFGCVYLLAAMHGKKEIIVGIVVAVIVYFICGVVLNNSTGESKDSSKETTENDASTKKKASLDDNKKDEEADSEKADSTEVTVEEQVLLEQEGIKITLKELDNEAWMGPELKVLIENTTDKNVTVQANNVSVNGIMIEDIFSSDVAAGKSANDTITLMSSDLEKAGIEVIQNVELKFHVFDTDSWDRIFDSDTIRIATSMDGTSEQEVDDSGTVVVDKDGIKITIKEADNEESFWGADIYIYVENNTEKNVTVQADSTSINGFMVEPYFSCDVAAGKKAFDSITFMESDLEKNNITSIDNMEIKFHVYDTDSTETIFDSETSSVSFE